MQQVSPDISAGILRKEQKHDTGRPFIRRESDSGCI